MYLLYEYIFICLYRQQSIHKRHADNAKRRQNKIICCGVRGHVKINIYWGGQFEKNKKYDYEQNPNKKFFKEKISI